MFKLVLRSEKSISISESRMIKQLLAIFPNELVLNSLLNEMKMRVGAENE